MNAIPAPTTKAETAKLKCAFFPAALSGPLPLVAADEFPPAAPDEPAPPVEFPPEVPFQLPPPPKAGVLAAWADEDPALALCSEAPAVVFEAPPDEMYEKSFSSLFPHIS